MLSASRTQGSSVCAGGSKLAVERLGICGGFRTTLSCLAHVNAACDLVCRFLYPLPCFVHTAMPTSCDLDNMHPG